MYIHTVQYPRAHGSRLIRLIPVGNSTHAASDQPSNISHVWGMGYMCSVHGLRYLLVSKRVLGTYHTDATFQQTNDLYLSVLEYSCS